jgi:hypothetical protein
VGTAVVVSTFVDFTRLSVYATRFTQTGLSENLTLVACATLAAIAGAYLGNKLLKKSNVQIHTNPCRCDTDFLLHRTGYGLYINFKKKGCFR